MRIKAIDDVFIRKMRTWSVPLLRIALGSVFLWFGVLKVIDTSPVSEIITQTYSFLPQTPFLLILGIWEVAIGLGLVLKKALRFTLALLWLQMVGTLLAPMLSPELFFNGNNPFLLTLEGEFIVKNLILIAASLVIGGYEVKNKG